LDEQGSVLKASKVRFWLQCFRDEEWSLGFHLNASGLFIHDLSVYYDARMFLIFQAPTEFETSAKIHLLLSFMNTILPFVKKRLQNQDLPKLFIRTHDEKR
jgi:hypothetical protein